MSDLEIIAIIVCPHEESGRLLYAARAGCGALRKFCFAGSALSSHHHVIQGWLEHEQWLSTPCRSSPYHRTWTVLLTLFLTNMSMSKIFHVRKDYQCFRNMLSL